MKCDCITVVGRKIADHMKPKAGDDAKAEATSTALMITDAGLESVLQIPFRVKGSKKGFTSEKGKEIGCNASFCPFCGRNTKHYEVGQDEGLALALGEEA